MMRRWTAPCAAILLGAAIIAGAIIASVQLFSSAQRPRTSTVAAARVTRSSSGDARLARGIEDARQRAGANEDEAASPTVADVLTFFNVLLYGPPPSAQSGPTVGEVLVFFNTLLYPSGPTPPSPTVADTLIFFHALLYGGTSTAAPPTPPPARQQAANAPAAPPPAPPPPPSAAPPAASSDVWTDASFTRDVWNAVNARRAQQGLSAVSAEGRLSTAAHNYAVLISEDRWFSHTGPDGSSFVDRIVAAGFPFTVKVGEVLAMGSDGWPPDGVVQAWIDSPPHRQQLLDPAYTRAGLECAFTHENGALMVRCVMEFAAG
jgi:uncharacterized protein YkwD